MLDSETKNRINTARDILVGKVPDPKSQVEQITIALIYKFMDDMDVESEEMGGKRTFFCGEYAKYSWRKIFDPRQSGHELLNLYSEAIAKMDTNPGVPKLFRDIFKNAYLPYRDPETLKSFLKIINEFEYSHSEKLGDAFEFLLSILGSQGDAGQFRTPRHIIDFMVAIMDPKKHEIMLDPACGTAGFLISSYKHIIKQNSSNYTPDKDPGIAGDGTQSVNEVIITSNGFSGDKLTANERSILADNMHGYDISPDMVRLSLVNMYLHGIKEPQIFEYDTLTSEDHWNEYSDVILANPPFMSPKGGIRPHKRFSVQSNRSEVLFVDYIAEHLTQDGRAAVIVPEGIIFQGGNAYKQLRKMLVEKYLVGVISLPAGVFNPYSGVKTSILWLDKTLAKKTDKILFAKIMNDGFDLGAQRRSIKHNDLPGILRMLISYKDSLIFESFSAIDYSSVFLTSKTDISNNGDYNLSAERLRVKEDHQKSQWDIVKLGEVILDMKDGGTPSRTNKDYFGGTIHWCVVKDIKPIITSTSEKLTELGLKNCSAKVWQVDSIIISLGATIGNVGIAKIPTATKQGLSGIVPDKTKILPEFLYCILVTSREKIQSFASGVTIKEVRPSKLKELLSFPLPPLSIQKEIVKEIESYQKIIDGARQVVENYRPRIDINPEWKMVELGDKSYFKVEAGGTPSSKEESYWNGNIDWATLVDLPQSDYISEINSTVRKITDAGLKNSSAKIIPPNSIIVSTRATIGRVAINKVPLATNQGFKNIIIKNKSVNPDFIALMMKSLEEKMNALATGGTFKELSKTNFCTLQIPLPPFETQKIIVTHIEKEQNIVKSNKILIGIFEQKIKDRIGKVWGE
ncbi:MAG: N-6 DNA methylase [Bacteroidia bacterium]|nr:N-6 DNA methylase [Bacteroidia bacterium]